MISLQMRKYIVCGKYQVKSREVKIEANNIQWKCSVCNKINQYLNEHVVLPETNLLEIEKVNILKSIERSEAKNVKIVIDINNVKNEMDPYYSPCFKDQIAKICEIDLLTLKDMDTLDSQSQWFARYRVVLKGFSKFIGKNNLIKYENSQATYLIYLIHRYVRCLQANQQYNAINLSILLLSANDIFCFKIQDVTTISPTLAICFKVYCLLQLQDISPWLIKMYLTELSEHRIVHQAVESKTDKMILIGNNFRINQECISNLLDKIHLNASATQLITNNSILLVKSQDPDENNNTFLVGHSKYSLLNQLSKKYSSKDSQSAIIFYRQNKNAPIALHKLDNAQIQKLKYITLNKLIEQKALKSLCKQLLKNNSLYSSKIKLVKLYRQIGQLNEVKVILYTFDWYKIQKEQILEELSQETESHQIKEDILNEGAIKLNIPSPFLKKHTLILQPKYEPNEEDYQYL